MAGALETLTLRRGGDGVVVLGLDRPARANALTRRMFDEIVATCADLDADPEVRAVVLTGSGGAFCVGYDIDDAGDFAALGPHAALALQDSGVRAVRAPSTTCPARSAGSPRRARPSARRSASATSRR